MKELYIVTSTVQISVVYLFPLVNLIMMLENGY